MNINDIKPTPSVALADLSRELKAKGREIITLQTGEPDFNTPSHVKEKTNFAIESNQTKYSYSSGLPELRSFLAETYTNTYQLEMKKDQFIVTAGAVQGISSVISAMIELNDEVIILEPAWPTVKSLVLNNGGIPKCISFLDNENLLNDIKKNISSATKLVYLNFPNNPSGELISSKTFIQILDLLKKKNIYLVSDEVYEYFDFVNDSDMSLPPQRFKYENFICINSFSKKYCMTGFRIGYVYSADLDALKNVSLASQINITNVPEFTQQAALEAISHPDSKKFINQMYSVLRDRFYSVDEILQNHQLNALNGGGAFYKFIHINKDDISFSEHLLKDFSVCVVPGSAYGECGKNFIRITYAEKIEKVKEGINRIAESLKNFK
tara:strand:- start:919 stop:2064 length:1146 start_codon:yes stop_codon:yes gene_type:complete